MYNEILNGYSDESHVYIVNGEAGPYVSFVSANDLTGVFGSEYHWDVCNGLVKDIRDATTPEELPHLTQAHNPEKPKVMVKKPLNNINNIKK